MKGIFKYKKLTLVIFLAYLVWVALGLETVLGPSSERFPVHRVLMILTAVVFLFNLHQTLKALGQNKLLIALILYVVITALWANNPIQVFKNFGYLMPILFIGVMISQAFYYDLLGLLKILFWLYIVIALANLLTCIYLPQIGINSSNFGRPRWIGITTHPNELGVQALILIWISANLFFYTNKKFKKIFLILSVCISLYIIIGADSMTSLLTSVIVLCYIYYCYSLGKLALPLKIILIWGISFVGLLVFVFYMNIGELAEAVLHSTNRNITLTGRSLLWANGFKSAKEKLVLGYGFDDLEQLTVKYNIIMSHLHNGYIEVLVKGGLIACLLLGFLFSKTIINQLKIKTNLKEDFIVLSSGFIMILIHNFAESSILRGLNTLNVFMIFIIVLTSLKARYG